MVFRCGGFRVDFEELSGVNLRFEGVNLGGGLRSLKTDSDNLCFRDYNLLFISLLVDGWGFSRVSCRGRGIWRCFLV